MERKEIANKFINSLKEARDIKCFGDEYTKIFKDYTEEDWKLILDTVLRFSKRPIKDIKFDIETLYECKMVNKSEFDFISKMKESFIFMNGWAIPRDSTKE